jgi:multiple sugar transport system ATP-binding protein
MSALPIANLKKTFGTVEVLKGINLEIQSGELIVLLGPSGCGKSTLLNIIAGLEGASEGTIEIGGRVVNDVAPKDRDIAMVFQSYALYPTMTVRQNITFGMECRKIPAQVRQEAVARIAQLLQIEPLLARKPGQLSGGQRQRVAMGRALVRDPILFLFDEPLSNLDAKLRVEMRTEIKRLHQRLGTTIVHVTHDQIEAMTLASRIAVMHRGEIQQFGDPETIYNRPANLFVARFMGSPPMNIIPANLSRDGDGLYATVEDLHGGSLRLPLPERDGAAVAFVGRKVALGIRPECISDAGRRFADEAELTARIEALVEVIEPTGAETMIVMRLGGREVVARRPEPSAVCRRGRAVPRRYAQCLPVRSAHRALDRMRGLASGYPSLAGGVVLIIAQRNENRRGIGPRHRRK